jgi:hypothetical protein
MIVAIQAQVLSFAEIAFHIKTVMAIFSSPFSHPAISRDSAALRILRGKAANLSYEMPRQLATQPFRYRGCSHQ